MPCRPVARAILLVQRVQQAYVDMRVSGCTKGGNDWVRLILRPVDSGAMSGRRGRRMRREALPWPRVGGRSGMAVPFRSGHSVCALLTTVALNAETLC